MQGIYIQQVDDLLELANALLTHCLLDRVNETLYKGSFDSRVAEGRYANTSHIFTLVTGDIDHHLDSLLRTISVN